MFAIVGLILALGGRRISPLILPLVAYVHSLGPIGPLLFILIYIAGVVLMIPGSWLTIAGGAVFGLVPAVVYAVTGATIGSTAAFMLGRHAARDFVVRHLSVMPRFSAIDRAVSSQGWRIVALMRLSPVVPFNFLNYALGLTTLPVRDFVIASVGMIPGAVMYAYAGAVAGQALALAGQAEMPKNASYYAMLGAGLVATVMVTAIVARAARRALRDV